MGNFDVISSFGSPGKNAGRKLKFGYAKNVQYKGEILTLCPVTYITVDFKVGKRPNSILFHFCRKRMYQEKNQSGAWYAEAVDRAVIRKLEKIKTLQGFKKFSGWRSRRNLQWATQGMS